VEVPDLLLTMGDDGIEYKAKDSKHYLTICKYLICLTYLFAYFYSSSSKCRIFVYALRILMKVLITLQNSPEKIQKDLSVKGANEYELDMRR